MLFFIGISYCFNATPAHGTAALGMVFFESRFTKVLRLLSWNVLGWWSGFGWSGGRGLGGVEVGDWGGVVVEDWVGDGWGCGECWSGCVVSVGHCMAVVVGEGCVYRGYWGGGCGVLSYIHQAHHPWQANGALKRSRTCPLPTHDAWRCMELPSPKPLASIRVYISYTGRCHLAIYQNGGAHGPPTTNFYIAKIPAPWIF